MGRDAQMRTGVLALVFTLSLGACATVPLGPSVMVLPGRGKSFDQFQADDAVCRQWASVQTGTTPQQAAGSSTAKSGVLGTLLGAGLGAAIGAATGHHGPGAPPTSYQSLTVGGPAGPPRTPFPCGTRGASRRCRGPRQALRPMSETRSRGGLSS